MAILKIAVMVISLALALIVPRRNHIDWLIRVNARKGRRALVGRWIKHLSKLFPDRKDGILPKGITRMVEKARI